MRELMARFVAGEVLTLAEEEEFLEWLTKYPNARQQLLDDCAMHNTLLRLEEFQTHEPDFVKATMRRIVSDVMVSHASVADTQGSRDPLGTATADGEVPHAGNVRVSAQASPTVSRPPSGRRTYWVVATAAAVVLLAISIIRPWHRAVEPMATDLSVSEQGGTSTFVQLVAADQPRWSRTVSEGERLAAREIELLTGTAVFKFDTGVTVWLKGPTSLMLAYPNEIVLDRGALRVDVPANAIGFTVSTPMGRVVDLGTEFEVSVDPSTRQAYTKVRRGRVQFLPAHANDLPGKPIELRSDDANVAMATLPANESEIVPVSTVVQGDRGQFFGTICARGKTMEFTQRDAFENCRSTVFHQVSKSPTTFEQQWSGLVEAWGNVQATVSASSASSHSHTMNRTMSFSTNGRDVSIEENGSGITVKITEVKGGRETKATVHVKSRAELEAKHPDAYQLYRDCFGAAADFSLPGSMQPMNALEMLRDQLRAQQESHRGNPQMQQILQEMIDDLHANDPSEPLNL
jgi:hypothetical protein